MKYKFGATEQFNLAYHAAIRTEVNERLLMRLLKSVEGLSNEELTELADKFADQSNRSIDSYLEKK